MAIETEEAIVRRIMELEARNRVRRETISYFGDMYRGFELEYYRAVEAADWVTMAVRSVDMRRAALSIRALRGWVTRYVRRIEELWRMIRKPPPFMRVVLTFSIETGEGNEPFYAEVTVETLIDRVTPADTRESMIDRIANAAIKLFFIHFDGTKVTVKGEPLRARLPGFWMRTTITEEQMDGFLAELIRADRFDRPPDEYLTRQSIIKIGVEYELARKEEGYEYPNCEIIIEIAKQKGQPLKAVIRKILVIAKETVINILEILEIVLERIV